MCQSFQELEGGAGGLVHIHVIDRPLHNKLDSHTLENHKRMYVLSPVTLQMAFKCQLYNYALVRLTFKN